MRYTMGKKITIRKRYKRKLSHTSGRAKGERDGTRGIKDK